MVSIFKMHDMTNPVQDEKSNNEQREYDCDDGESPYSLVIEHDDSLIEQLKVDHVRMLSLFVDLRSLARRSDWHRLRGKLTEFKLVFHGHLIRENVRFYGALEQSNLLASSADDLHEFRCEINHITRKVMDFCNQTIAGTAVGIDLSNFLTDCDEITEALLCHVEREERDLYPLYSRLKIG